MSEVVHAPTTAPEPVHPRKLPMAVSIVGILVALAAVINLALGALVLVSLCRVAGLTVAQLFEAPLHEVTVQVGGTSMSLQPMDGFYLLAVGGIQILLLFGFRRLRRWAWLGLMAWSGLQLAVVLYRYFTTPGDHLRDFVGMAVHSIVVLTLNAEEVQEAFGIRQPPAATVPLRPAAPGSEAPHS
jgi:hypothetical protein